MAASGIATKTSTTKSIHVISRALYRTDDATGRSIPSGLGICTTTAGAIGLTRASLRGPLDVVVLAPERNGDEVSDFDCHVISSPKEGRDGPALAPRMEPRRDCQRLPRWYS